MQDFEKNLKKTFQHTKTEIADHGFSEKVMQQLPVRNRTHWIVTIFTLIGVTLTYLLNGIDHLIILFNMALQYFININLPYINQTTIITILIALVLLIFYIDYEESTV
jgi:biotin transporter BioY